MELEQPGFRSDLRVTVFYHGEFGERFIANLMNYRNSCPSFGACGIDECVQCKENVYSFSRNIIASFGMIDPLNMPDFIEEPDDFLPKEIPEADIAIAINLHPDILISLPERLSDLGYRAYIVPVEEPRWCSAGLAKQIKERCSELRIEFAAPKPFCILRESDEHPTINRFIREMGIGYPEFEIDIEKTDDWKRIASVRIIRSQPCGCAWYVGIRLRELEFSEIRELWDVVAEAHHSYPCTASMEKDNEYNETILHIAGYAVRHAVDKAVGYRGDEEVPEHIRHIIYGDQRR